MNKKASEKYLSIWWFFSLIIVATAIVAGVMTFYSGDIDTRSFETSVMIQKTIHCLSNYGVLADEFMKDDFNLASFCGFSAKLISGDSSSQYLIMVRLMDSSGTAVKEKFSGRTSFENDCPVGQAIKSRKYPICLKKEVEVNYYDNGMKNGVLNILTVSDNLNRGLFA